jgi:hypothetical protein
MTPDTEHEASSGAPITPMTVRVDFNGHGTSEIVLPEHERVTCKTLDDARREAYLCAEHRRPCELIVRDAYHRVLQRELMNGHGSADARDHR